MTRGHMQGRRFTGIAIALTVLASISGCAGKAESLKLAASQFGVTSVQAIESVTEMNRKRLAAPQLTENEALENVVSGLQEAMAANPVQTVDFDTLSNLRDPFTVSAPKTDAAAAEFIGRMRNEYRTFASIFDRLDEGSALAAESVKSALPISKKLTVQLVVLAKLVESRPLEFIVFRKKLAADIKKTLERWKADGVQASANRPTVDEWLQRQKAISSAEASTKRAVLLSLTKAASLGYDVSNQIENYDQLSLSDITEALKIGLSIAEGLTGKDLSAIEGRIDEIVAGINSDPSWKGSVELALKELNQSNLLQKDAAKIRDAFRESTGSGGS